MRSPLGLTRYAIPYETPLVLGSTTSSRDMIDDVAHTAESLMSACPFATSSLISGILSSPQTSRPLIVPVSAACPTALAAEQHDGTAPPRLTAATAQKRQAKPNDRSTRNAQHPTSPPGEVGRRPGEGPRQANRPRIGGARAGASHFISPP